MASSATLIIIKNNSVLTLYIYRLLFYMYQLNHSWSFLYEDQGQMFQSIIVM